ncbi:hypothetical protein ACK389_10590 [Streptomyces antibioticus]|uniref:hypothetical protein n=1 Tax=Streptomyces TaxID=1883 RepID=UPI001675E359|nr:hypothetical protein [Streptomyces tanashiensis]GGT22271.1 hypothetical protein GCM10010222_75210 [Streptomyces tanashiensis]
MRTKLTSAELTVRIEDLYGAPLTTLEAHAQTQPPGMLAALLGSRHDLAFAERTIAFHRDRLLQLIQPERGIGAHEASHLLDCARRIAEAVAAREAQAKTAAAVLNSLGRVRACEAPAVAVALAPPKASATTAPSR